MKIPDTTAGQVPQVSVEIDEEFLQRVRDTMPPQPWPTGAAKEAATKLNVPANAVTKAISALVDRGVFKLQVDGKLFIRDEKVT